MSFELFTKIEMINLVAFFALSILYVFISVSNPKLWDSLFVYYFVWSWVTFFMCPVWLIWWIARM